MYKISTIITDGFTLKATVSSPAAIFLLLIMQASVLHAATGHDLGMTAAATWSEVTAAAPGPTLVKFSPYGEDTEFVISNTRFHNVNMLLSAPIFAGSFYLSESGDLYYHIYDRYLASSRDMQRPGALLKEAFIHALAVEPLNLRQSASSPSAAHRQSGATGDSIYIGEIYPGVLFSIAGRANNVEKIFTLLPGTDPSIIGIALESVDDVRVKPDGELAARRGSSFFNFTKPVAYQIKHGRKHAIPVNSQ